MPGDSDSSELGNTKYWPAYPVIIFARLLMDRLNCPVVKNWYRISTERLLYQSTLVQRISLSKLAFLNSEHRILSPLPLIFRGCLPNVIKRWKSSTESVRPFVANNYHNWSMANRQLTCRQGQQFFSHYESLKMCTMETINS